MDHKFENDAYLKSPHVISAPNEYHSIMKRRFQGIPSLAISLSGRLWATWYAGSTPGEDHNNYVVIASSVDDGATWEECLVVDPDYDGPVRAFDPELWVDPIGRLWFFWAQAIGHDGTIAGVWAMTNDNPDTEGSIWSPPRRLANGIMMCKPIVLSDGDWMLPASTWRKTDNSAKVIVSTNQGKSWKIRGACHVQEKVRSYDEHMIVEKLDGTLLMLVRTSYGIGQSVSQDRGRTWTKLAPSSIQHTSSRFFIYRLHSGNLLLIKHGPIHVKTGRSQLTACISFDDGQTWSSGLLLDKRKNVSYPDGQEGLDGTIRIVYDHSRTKDREILMCKFNEEDISRGKLVSAHAAVKVVVSKYPGNY